MKSKSTYVCPLCNHSLSSREGTDQMPLFGGITLFCPSMKCPAQEVMGHARNERGAYDIIMSKYTGKRIQMDTSEDEPVTSTAVETLPSVEAEDVI